MNSSADGHGARVARRGVTFEELGRGIGPVIGAEPCVAGIGFEAFDLGESADVAELGQRVPWRRARRGLPREPCHRAGSTSDGERALPELREACPAQVRPIGR